MSMSTDDFDPIGDAIDRRDDEIARLKADVKRLRNTIAAAERMVFDAACLPELVEVGPDAGRWCVYGMPGTYRTFTAALVAWAKRNPEANNERR